MQKPLRQTVVQGLWEKHRVTSPQIPLLEKGLKQRGIEKFTLDHFAVIDLPGPHTGIPVLSQIFSVLGYVIQGKDYLPDKQNDFTWMAETDSKDFSAVDVLPQVVVADFRLDEMPLEIKNIISKYANLAAASPLPHLQQLAQQIASGHTESNTSLCQLIMNYFAGRDWPLPTTTEFHTVREFNELLAWVLIFGRRPNHFTVSVHLLDQFPDLADFNQFIESTLHLELNREGGVIKGGKSAGIAQSATIGTPQTIKLLDGNITLPTGFIEFAWRYPRDPGRSKPFLWKDFFTGFVAQHADKVIESLY